MDDFLKGSQLVNMRNACLWTPLMKASINGHIQAVKKLLSKGAEVDLTDKGGYSAMMLAASNNFYNIVSLLVTQGADINRVELTNGWTSLIWAAKRGHVETVKVLLKNNADISIRDNSGNTALDYARQNNITSLIVLLESDK